MAYETITDLLEDEGLEQQRAINGALARTWTALPGIVDAFNPDDITVSVQPAVRGRTIDENGNVTEVNLPLLADCPVVFPHAGGASITFPIKKGDEVLVVFASRSIDNWWALGGLQAPAEIRMHDLSDGFAIPGVWSQKTKITNVSTTHWQVRSDDGTAFLELNVENKDMKLKTPANLVAEVGKVVTAKIGGNLTATIGGSTSIESKGSVTVTTPTLTINGNLVLNGSLTSKAGSGGSGAVITGDVVADGISLKGHVHGGVQSGPSNTSTPK